MGVQDIGSFEYPQRLRRRGPRTLEQVDRSVHRDDRVLRKQLEEAQAEYGHVVAREQPRAALTDDRMEAPGCGADLLARYSASLVLSGLSLRCLPWGAFASRHRAKNICDRCT